MISDPDEVHELYGKYWREYWEKNDADPYFDPNKRFERMIDDDWVPDYVLEVYVREGKLNIDCNEMTQPEIKSWDQMFLDWLEKLDVEPGLRRELISEIMSQDIYELVFVDSVWGYEVNQEKVKKVLDSFDCKNIDEFKLIADDYLDFSDGWTTNTPKSKCFHQKMHQLGLVPTVYFEDVDEDLERLVVSVLYGNDYDLGSRGVVFPD